MSPCTRPSELSRSRKESSAAASCSANDWEAMALNHREQIARAVLKLGDQHALARLQTMELLHLGGRASSSCADDR